MWPSGIEQVFHDVEVNQVLELDEPASPYEAWLGAHFSPGEIAEGNLTEPLADPDRDGRSNLLEFGTGSDPRGSGSISPVRVFPGLVPGEFTVSFRRRNLPRGGRAVLEASSDLQTWEKMDERGMEILKIEPAAEWGVETVTARLSAEMNYLRLWVGMSN
jgi:hypothetical protein